MVAWESASRSSTKFPKSHVELPKVLRDEISAQTEVTGGPTGTRRSFPKGGNGSCPCSSGKKYKKCHGH
ncbi:MAG: hypothetical protein FJ217_02705 [Ignavibacteria bacterium]|nr:hypothetical protein [Ignavibacteria bacterium]